MEWAVISGIIIAILSALTWGSYKYGQVKEREKSAEEKANDMAHDAEIATKPGVDRPLGRMRPKG